MGVYAHEEALVYWDRTSVRPIPPLSYVAHLRPIVPAYMNLFSFSSGLEHQCASAMDLSGRRSSNPAKLQSVYQSSPLQCAAQPLPSKGQLQVSQTGAGSDRVVWCFLNGALGDPGADRPGAVEAAEDVPVHGAGM